MVRMRYAGGAHRGISPVVTTVLLIAATLISALAVAGFVFGLFGSFGGLSAKITPDIYAPSQNVGVLNSVANFSVSISNKTPNDVSGAVNLTAGAVLVTSQPFVIHGGKTILLTLSHELTTTGLWTVAVSSQSSVVVSYTFQVELDANQANLVIDQANLAQASVTQGYWNLALSAGLVLLGALNIVLLARDRGKGSKKVQPS